jgi:hypothetical protein
VFTRLQQDRDVRLLVGAVAILILTAVWLGPGPAPARAAGAQPRFIHVDGAERQLFLHRVDAAPPVLRRLIKDIYPRLRVRTSHGKLGGGNRTITIINRGPYKFAVALSERTLGPGIYGRHMTMHELGHVVTNAYFDEADYGNAFELFGSSPRWRDCFPSQPGALDPCVGSDEILAEQIAFLVPPRSFRTTYGVPPLASRRAMERLLRSVD